MRLQKIILLPLNLSISVGDDNSPHSKLCLIRLSYCKKCRIRIRLKRLGKISGEGFRLALG
jgi:hypothetical protein